MTYQPDFPYAPGSARQRPYRILAGIAVSLAAHALLLLAYRDSLAPAPAPDRVREVRPLTLWLRPAVPEPEPVAAPAAKPARPAARRLQARRRPPARSPVIALPDSTPRAPEPPDVFAVEPQQAGPAPRFDPEAARRLARQIASEPDPARAGTAVGQIKPKPYATETRAARAIARAKRRDCKDGLPGGLLGPLIILMDKKDSGCKW